MSSKDERQFTDEFDLLYIRGVHGWSELHVVTHEAHITTRITHIFSDPIEELCGLCCDLLQGESSSMARLHDEPGATVAIVSVHAKQKHVGHIEFWNCPGWDDVPPCGTLKLVADVKIRQFVGLVYRQFEKVRWLHEDKSYQKNRSPFPHAAFETLQRLWMTYNYGDNTGP
jgi:hypothetical protein